jgi:hypothetical protein
VKITNRYNLPKAFLGFARANEYSKGESDFSASGLIEPPQIGRLKAKYESQIELDVSDNIFSLFGTAIHNVLESGIDPSDERDKVEERLYADVDGVTISGQVDLLTLVSRDVGWDKGSLKLQDYKTCSANTITYNPQGKSDWVAQLSIYKWLAIENGYSARIDCEIVAIIRDWSKSKAAYTRNYPPRMVHVMKIETWSHEDTRAYIEARIAAHTQPAPAECTDEERWKGPSKFAVVKYKADGGLASRAARVLDSLSGANDYLMENLIHGEIVERPGAPIRCADYCEVAKFCSQYQRELK